MTQKLLLISICLILSLITHAQVETDCDSLKLKIQHDKDSLPKFDVFMKDRLYGLSFNATYDKNYAFGAGYYLYADLFSRYRRIPSPSLETNINYHLDGYLYHTLTVKIPLLISPSLSFCTYTDFNKASFFVRPGIGIDVWIVNMNYSQNWTVVDNLEMATKHNFSLYFRLGIIQNTWKDADIDVSQWDKHKAKQK